MPMLSEHENSLRKQNRVDNLGPVFIPCGDDVESLLTVIKVWESVLHANVRQYPAIVCGAGPERSTGKVNYADH
jgi:hypothetical protein